MKRRDSLIGAGALLLAAAQGSAQAQTPAQTQAMPHDHHHMHGAAPLQALLAAASDCVAKGQSCLAHCLVLLADGDKAMAACAQSVSQTIALCNALESLAAQQSSLVPALAKVTLQACEACEKECRKHEQHAQCKACAESCLACIKECKAVMG
jgi:Cys-rich four helix bundle protein (predicted Tat secretion target)